MAVDRACGQLGRSPWRPQASLQTVPERTMPLQVEQSLRALDAHYQAMPPVAAMQLRIAGYDGDALTLEAPLALHDNDKGCAFGGSLVSLLTLASWGLVTLHVQQAGLDADVFVARSEEHTSELQSRDNLVCRLL